VEVEDRDDGSYALKLWIKGASDLKLLVSVAKERNIAPNTIVDQKLLNEFAAISLFFTTHKAYDAKIEREARKAAQQQGGAGGGLARASHDGHGGAAGMELLSGDAILNAHHSRTSQSSGGSGGGGAVSAFSSTQSAAGGAPSEAAAAAAPSSSSSSAALAKLRAAGKEIMQGFGAADERRAKKLHGSAQAAVESAIDQMRKDGASVAQARTKAGSGAAGGPGSRRGSSRA